MVFVLLLLKFVKFLKLLVYFCGNSWVLNMVCMVFGIFWIVILVSRSNLNSVLMNNSGVVI